MPRSSTPTPRPFARAGEFYNFTRTLEVYKEALKGETRLILTTDSELLRMIKTLEPSRPPALKTSPVAAAEKHQ